LDDDRITIDKSKRRHDVNSAANDVV
jgi:hypothetical protein